MEPTTAATNSIAGQVYEGVFSIMSYFALEYTSNWNWHLEDLGSLIPVSPPHPRCIARTSANDDSLCAADSFSMNK